MQLLLLLLAVAPLFVSAGSLRRAIHNPTEHQAAVKDARATVVTADHIRDMNKHLDDIEKRLKAATQESVNESEESCANPSPGTAPPTVVSKEFVIPALALGAPEEPMTDSNFLQLSETPGPEPGCHYSHHPCVCRLRCPIGQKRYGDGSACMGGGVSNCDLGYCHSNPNPYPACVTPVAKVTDPSTTPPSTTVFKTTIVGCLGESKCQADTAEKETAFDEHIACIRSKQANIKTEKTVVIEQETCVTRARNGEFTLSKEDQAIVARHERQKAAHTQLLKALQDMRAHIVGNQLKIPKRIEDKFRFATKGDSIEPRFKEMASLVQDMMSTDDGTFPADLVKALTDLLDKLIVELRSSLKLDVEAGAVETKKQELLKRREEEMVTLCTKNKVTAEAKIATLIDEATACESELKIVAGEQSEQLPACLTKHKNFQAQFELHSNELAAVKNMRKILNGRVKNNAWNYTENVQHHRNPCSGAPKNIKAKCNTVYKSGGIEAVQKLAAEYYAVHVYPQLAAEKAEQAEKSAANNTVEDSEIMENHPEENKKAAATGGNKVTCQMTIDNFMDKVEYNGKKLSIAGNPKDWGATKTVTFTTVYMGRLVVVGHDLEAGNRGHCNSAGFVIKCSSPSDSFWNGFTSGSKNILAQGSETATGPDFTWKKPKKACTTTSGFNMNQVDSSLKKIWAPDGERGGKFTMGPDTVEDSEIMEGHPEEEEYHP